MEKNSSSPLVSVIIPTINFDQYTHQSILSIFAQTYLNWEIILVLDGGSAEQVPQSITDHARVKVVRHTRRLGTPISLNDGIKAARGGYIARLDADDIAHPERLEFQVAWLQAHQNVCCLGTGGVLIDNGGKYLGDLPFKSSSSDIRVELLEKNQLVHSSVMYRRSIFNLVGGYNPLMVRMQDYDLFLRMGKIAPLAYVDKSMCAYRTHPGQHSKKTSPFKVYSVEILRQRRSLRKTLNNAVGSQLLRDLRWYAAQVLRYMGLRKPGYKDVVNPKVLAEKDLMWINPQ